MRVASRAALTVGARSATHKSHGRWTRVGWFSCWGWVLSQRVSGWRGCSVICARGFGSLTSPKLLAHTRMSNTNTQNLSLPLLKVSQWTVSAKNPSIVAWLGRLHCSEATREEFTPHNCEFLILKFHFIFVWLPGKLRGNKEKVLRNLLSQVIVLDLIEKVFCCFGKLNELAAYICCFVFFFFSPLVFPATK